MAIITHGGPIKTILREILNQEDINDVKDCGFALIENKNSSFRLIDDKNLYRS